jgi:hypothetical protein
MGGARSVRLSVPKGYRGVAGPTTDEGPDQVVGALIMRTEQLPRQDSNLN